MYFTNTQTVDVQFDMKVDAASQQQFPAVGLVLQFSCEGLHNKTAA